MPKESPSGCHCCEREERVGDAYAEWGHNKLGSAILALAVEFSGQVVSRFQRSVSDGKTAYERRKHKSCRKALVPFGELVMFVPMENEIWNRVASCWASFVGTTERVVKARIVHRMLGGQRGDARYAKSIRGTQWQPNPAEAAEGEPFVRGSTERVGFCIRRVWTLRRL